MNKDLGAPASPSGSRASHEARSGLHPTGFDPSREWKSYAAEPPTEAGVYEWRVPSRAVPGISVQFFAHMRMRGNGYGPDILSPLFDHWDGYRVSVPAGTEWREAVEPPPCKDYQYVGLTVPGLEIDPCPFCHATPALKANDTSPSGGVAICGEPHRFNTWWLECCGWVRSFGPRYKDPRDLITARRRALHLCDSDGSGEAGLTRSEAEGLDPEGDSAGLSDSEGIAHA